jgi:cytochrome c
MALTYRNSLPAYSKGSSALDGGIRPSCESSADRRRLGRSGRRAISRKIDDHQRRSTRIGLRRKWPQNRHRAVDADVVFRVQTMQRVGSYVAAAVVIIAMVAGIFWVVRVPPAGAPGLQTAGPYKFKAIPVGADGPLRECVVCHSVETGGALRVGPPLHGIVGARKARADWYGYSPALRKAGGNWTEADLDKFLASPAKFLPGTSKTIVGIPDAKQRADIIAALKNAP